MEEGLPGRTYIVAGEGRSGLWRTKARAVTGGDWAIWGERKEGRDRVGRDLPRRSDCSENHGNLG